jgi:hypothetical protein
MTATPTLFAGDGEPCASCGAPLAADQRYCLTCGHRRADARLPFLEILRDDPATQLVPLHQPVPALGGAGGGGYGATPPEDGFAGRARANTGLIAGVGVLLLAMLIGVLIGSGFNRDDGSAAFANQKPVVVSVGGGAVAPAAAPPAATMPTDTGAATTPAPATTDTTAADPSKDSDPSAKAAEQSVKPKTVSKSKIKDLDKLSGKEYQKEVDKLGKNIASGGKAPPKDNKPAAGGGDFQDIG